MARFGDEVSFAVPKISAREANSNMKVLALVIFAIASVSGSGSGPYLPSGWRPQGPAFYLPSEVQKPAENLLKDAILNESEASGSDALREYGPPKVVEVSQDLTRQALPQTVTEQAFVVIEAKFTEDVNGVKEVSEVRAIEEVKAEQVTEGVEAIEVTTEQKVLEEATTETIEEKTTETEQGVPQGRAIDVQTIEETVETQDATESDTTAEIAQVTESVATAVVDSNVESTQVDVSQASAVEEVSQAKIAEVAEVAEEAQGRTAEGVQNVAEALTNLEKEIKAQQVQTNEEAVEVKSVQVLGSVEQAQEGFLEYGPPGFREYGPPQAEDLVRSGAIVQEATEEEQKIENNETRRRRFSPKFRFSKKH